MSRTQYAWKGLTWAATAVSLFLSFQGQVPHLWILLGFLAAWGLRYSLSPAFRLEMAALTGRLWQACADYSRLDTSPPWRAAAALVVLPAACFFLANGCVDDGDNLPVMLAATSLASEGNWELSEFLDRPAYAPFLGGIRTTARGTYSTYPSGPVQFALPVVLVSKFIGGDYQRFQVQRRLHKWAAAWLSAACLGLFFLTCLHLAEPAPAWVLALLLATGSAMYSTVGQGLWQHGGILFWSQLVVFLEFRQAIRPSRHALWLQGLALALMLACRLSAVLLFVPLVGWVFLRDWRRGVALAVMGALFFLPWAGLYFSIYGQPFGPSTWQLARSSWHWDRVASAFAGVLVSPGRGFFVYQVWGLLAFGALLEWATRGGQEARNVPHPRGWHWVCVSAFLLNLAMVSAWSMWWGGWCWGSRLLTDSLLLFALLCVQPLARLWEHLPGRRLILAVAAIGFLVHMPFVYLGAARWNGTPADIDSHPRRLWSWQRAPFLYPLQRPTPPAS